MAEHIGRVAMVASALDASLASLVGAKTQDRMSAWGLSGGPLADLVHKFDPDTAGR